MPDGALCGFHVEDERDGELDLVLFFGTTADHPTRTLFQGFVEKFLVDRNLSFTRYDSVICRQCMHHLESKIVRDR